MSRYSKIKQLDLDDVELRGSSGMPQRSQDRRAQLVTAVLLVFSLFLNFILAWRPDLNLQDPSPPRGRFARTQELDTVWNRFFWNTEWSPHKNHSASDHLWEKIKPSHGFVAIDREEAAEKGYPDSMYLPSDHSKGVYLLEGYHQLHCLSDKRIIRQTFWEAVEGREYTYPPPHTEHCFDALRQSTMCNADNTPLYTFGDKTAGDGQIHRCKSWHQLRDYATANSACYRDSVGDIPLGEHFGFCEDHADGEDGIDTSHYRVD